MEYSTHSEFHSSFALSLYPSITGVTSVFEVSEKAIGLKLSLNAQKLPNLNTSKHATSSLQIRVSALLCKPFPSSCFNYSIK